MATVRKVGTRVSGGARPKAIASGLTLFPRVQKPSYKKDSLQPDPAKFGNIGFNLNMFTPSIAMRGK